MIIGNGLIASGFKSYEKDYLNYIIFASGVSNSKESNFKEFDREKKLLTKTVNDHKNLKLIYFSSILTGIVDNEYYNKKLENEKLIEELSSNYIIFRIPQILGNKGNPNNLINYFKNCIKNQEEIIIHQNTQRSLIDIEDLVNVVNYCKDKAECEILNFSYLKKINVLDLCYFLGFFLNKKPIVKCINSNTSSNWDIDNSELIKKAILNIDLHNYNYNVIKKYLEK